MNKLTNPYTHAKFLKSAARVDQLPEDTGYEVAFAGRSNAGKSSALNALTGIRQLARTSKTPGRTQLINVFALSEKDPTRRLIDLPGYGYAKVPMQVKQDWQKHLAHYLDTRQSLKGLVILMDIRHPLTELDQSMVGWAMMRQLPVHLLLTKADKLSHGAVQNTVLQVRKHYANMLDLITVQAFSSLKKQGIETLIQKLNQWLSIDSDASS